MSLSPHELDVLRTVAVCVGTGMSPLLAIGVGWAIKLLRHIRHDAEQARNNTEIGERSKGNVHAVSVAELARDGSEQARHAKVSGEATRQEVSDLAGWMRGTGRRRQPTGTAPTLSRYQGDAHDG